MMQTSATAYYAYARGATYRETAAQKICREKVEECFYEHRRRYGSRRIAKQLRIGRWKTRSVMKHAGLRAIAPKRFKPRTTDSRHEHRISPNLLQNDLNAPVGKGEVIVGHYLSAFEGRHVLLFGDISGQVYAADCRVAGVSTDDSAACHRRFFSGEAARVAQTRRDYSYGSRQSIRLRRISKIVIHRQLSPINVAKRKLL